MVKKVIFITNIIPPYRVPVLNYIARASGFDFQVLFMRAKEHNRAWDIPLKDLRVPYEILPGLHLPIKKMDWEIHFNLSIWGRLNKENPDIIIMGGYDAPTIWLAFIWAKLHHRKIIFWVGSTLFSSKRQKGIIGLIKRFFIQHGNAFIAYGQASRNYLLYFKIPDDKIFIGCNVCDQKLFRESALAYRNKPEFLSERKKYSSIVFLSTGRFVAGKGLIEMLTALSKMSYQNWSLVMVGDGPLLPQIQDFIKDRHLEGRVRLTGFKQQQDLTPYYSLADIFIFPSKQEVYGIVVSEALASGLFVLSSQYAGATYDLIQEGTNGYIIDPDNPGQLQHQIERAINKFTSQPPDRNKISDSIEKFTPERYGQQVINAINSL